MIYEKELSDKIIGCCLEVNRHLKSGFLEKVYENSLMIELKLNGIKAENQIPLEVNYKETPVGDYIVDILVENKVLLELKSCKSLNDNHVSQLINYLTITGIKVGYIINFGNEKKLEFKRIVK